MRKKIKTPESINTQIGKVGDLVFVKILRKDEQGREKDGEIALTILKEPIKVGFTIKTDNLLIPFQILTINPRGKNHEITFEGMYKCEIGKITPEYFV